MDDFIKIKKELTKLQKEYNQMNKKTEFKKIIKKMKWFKTRYKYFKEMSEKLIDFLEKEEYIIIDNNKYRFNILKKSDFDNNFEETCEKLHLYCTAGCERTKKDCYYLNPELG